MPLLPRQSPEETRAASLMVINPSGNRSRITLSPLPYTIGRQADNHLVLRDNRASRNHARIVQENGEYILEDLNSRHGVYVNGQRITRQPLVNSDRIEFGFQDSYKLVFSLEDGEIQRIIEQISAPPSGTGHLAKLRSLVEVARALQTSLSTEDVLAAVVDAALAVTATERGFLLLRKGDGLEVSVARDRNGAQLSSAELKVPTSLINRALRTRRELLSMSFDPLEQDGIRPDMSVAGLELRSVVCVPLIHVRPGAAQDTMLSSVNDTAGMLYMDSRQTPADLSAGNREILQTLALEASTVLENARLLAEEREKLHLEQELAVAREIQTGLLPSGLPSAGWFRAAGSSIASHQVGGDYFDVRQAGPNSWAVIIADVSGKGVSSALLAALLQGAFLFASEEPMEIAAVMSRINRFLNERAKGEKYATAFYGQIEKTGSFRYANAGHPKPVLVRSSGGVEPLETTGMPLGMLDGPNCEVREIRLEPGDKVVLFTDGLSEAENGEGQFFDRQKLRETIRAHAQKDFAGLHSALLEALDTFAEGSPQSDDVTLLVLEYAPDGAAV